jgi:tRNA 5-methylaminomethyl-2-thiouridine biosynthesis bifunctional protein
MAVKKVAVIGAGLAGCASAFFLSKFNNFIDGNEKNVYEIDLFEQDKEIALGASGNDYGVIYPRLELNESRDSIFYRNSFDFLLDFLPTIPDIDYNQCGTFIIPAKKERLDKFIHSFQTRGHISGYKELKVSNDNALFLANGGFLSPKKLATNLANQSYIKVFTESNISEVTFNKEKRKWHLKINGEDRIFDLVILANSFSVNRLESTKNIFIEKVKGQVSKIAAKFIEADIKQVICKDCYIIPKMQDNYYFGATFERNMELAEVTSQGHIDNLIKLNQILQHLGSQTLEASTRSESLYNMHGKAGFRTYSKDRMPLIGALDSHENLYINSCHGSRGILSAVYGGFLLAKLICKKLNREELSDLDTVDPNRLRL